MKFDKIGIKPQNDNSVKGNKGIKIRFPFFGVKKGEKIQPLKKDTVQLEIADLPAIERELAIVVSSLSEKSIGSPELFQKFLTEIVKNGTEENPELLVTRTEFLKNEGKNVSSLIEDLIIMKLQGNENTSFLLDNLSEINNILEKKQVPREIKKEILSLLNSDNIEKFKTLAENESLTGEEFAIIAMYNSTDHNITFGEETVIVDSAEIIALLSGIQSISTIRENNYDKFNGTVSSLVEENHRDERLHYNQIAEGILQQSPKLAMIAKDYREYERKVGEKDLSFGLKMDAFEQYFNELDESGLLPKQIELKTIVPDENALLYPDYTLFAFLYNQSKKS